MCVLSGPEIKRRVSNIFLPGSWHEDCIQEATYDLRVDTKPLLRIGGKPYDPKNPYPYSHIEIKPGELAMLPTVECFHMPSNLVGSIKIKLSHSIQGLTPLFGPKVDPLFGREHKGERMYLWVSNLGLKSIHIERRDPVFTVEFHKLYGDDPPLKSKESAYSKFARQIHEMPPEPNLGFTGRIEDKAVARLKDTLAAYQGKVTKFQNRLDGLEQGNQQVVQFGVFLVASALLAAAIAAMFAMIFAFNNQSGPSTSDRLEGTNLEGWLFAMTIVLCLGVVLLFVVAAIQFSRSGRSE